MKNKGSVDDKKQQLFFACNYLQYVGRSMVIVNFYLNEKIVAI
mgnify:FL=1|jgi:hypothetical protein